MKNKIGNICAQIKKTNLKNLNRSSYKILLLPHDVSPIQMYPTLTDSVTAAPGCPEKVQKYCL